MFAKKIVILKDTAVKELVLMIYVIIAIKGNKIIEKHLIYLHVLILLNLSVLK